MTDKLLFRQHAPITMGADPEVFVFVGAKVLPAFQFLPEKGKGKQIYWDGYQAEFKFDEAFSCLEVMSLGIRRKLFDLSMLAKKHTSKARLGLSNVVKLSKTELLAAKDEHVTFGCKPSLNVYGIAGEPIMDPRSLRERFAGGHIHFGFYHEKPNVNAMVRNLDKILGVWAVGAAQQLDKPVRRRFYGLAGEHRENVYNKKDSRYQGDALVTGFEYRTLSNFWLCHPQIFMATFELARMICHWTAVDPAIDVWAATEAETLSTIQNNDVDQAKRILRRNQPLFHALWRASRFLRIPEHPIAASSKLAFEIGMDGVEIAVSDPDKIEKNWDLAGLNKGGVIITPRFCTMPNELKERTLKQDAVK